MGKAELLEKVGFFDENLLLFYEEPDYCKRAKEKGLLSYYFGNVSIIHLRAKTLAKLPAFARFAISEHDTLTYYKKHFGIFWWLFLWIAFRPNWLYWKLASFKDNETTNVL
jgi:GT2 family glycosyltransferase